MRIESIDADSPHLESVIALGREHKGTLGFLPRGAFVEYARDKGVLVALDDERNCVGYLLYRVVRDKATIAHFCVSITHRAKGYARALLETLVQATKSHRGILLTCRRDYDANRMWPRLGFHPIGERPGRAVGSELVIWWLGHGHRDLFTDVEIPGALRAAVDCNVFINLINEDNGAHSHFAAFKTRLFAGYLSASAAASIFALMLG